MAQAEKLHRESLLALRTVVNTSGHMSQKYHFIPPGEREINKRMEPWNLDFPLMEIEGGSVEEEVTMDGKRWKPGKRFLKSLKQLNEKVEELNIQSEECTKLSEKVRSIERDRVEFVAHQLKGEKRCPESNPTVDNLYINTMKRLVVIWKMKQKFLTTQLFRNFSAIPTLELENPSEVDEEFSSERERQKERILKFVKFKMRNKHHNYHTGIPANDIQRQAQKVGATVWAKGYDTFLLYKEFEKQYPDYHLPSRMYTWVASHLVESPKGKTLREACPKTRESLNQLLEMEAGLREIFPCKFFDQDTYDAAFSDELGDWEKVAMMEKKAEVEYVSMMISDNQREYEMSLANHGVYTSLLEEQMNYAILRKANLTSRVIKDMKELQGSAIQLERIRARVAMQKRRFSVFTQIYKDFLEKSGLKASDGGEVEVEGVDPEDRFTPNMDVAITMEKLREKIEKAMTMHNMQRRENLNEAMEKNNSTDKDLHDMATILLDDQEAETQQKFNAIMSKFILKGEEVKYTDLNKEIEKQQPKNLGAIPKRKMGGT